ncbi:MAG: galactose ABC transporter substrate-binding protein [Christensenella sp.]|nr:galactose ABC transporter substrate-binding protein [Christensenella sp.]
MKKLVAILLIAALALSMVACSSASTPAPAATEATAATDTAATEPAAAETSVKATVIWRAFDDQYQSGFRIIMQAEADKMTGIALDMQDGENDVTKTTNKLEAALTKGTDAVAICAPDTESTNSLMLKCKDESVPVVFFNMMPTQDTMNAYDKAWYVGAEASESGAMCAQALINYWNANTAVADKNGDGKLQLVVLQGEIGNNDVILRTAAYEDTLKAQGIDYEIIAMDTANWDKGQALDKMNAWITAFGIDGIEGVLCNNDGMAMGAVQAALNNGYNSGDPAKFVPIVGIDATVEALQAMKDGSLLGTVLNDRTNQSIAVINVLKAAISGTAITEDVVGVSCKVDGKYIWIPYQIVDSTNLDAVLEVMLSVS